MLDFAFAVSLLSRIRRQFDTASGTDKSVEPRGRAMGGVSAVVIPDRLGPDLARKGNSPFHSGRAFNATRRASSAQLYQGQTKQIVKFQGEAGIKIQGEPAVNDPIP